MHSGWVIKGDVWKLMALLLICALTLQNKEADSCADYKLDLGFQDWKPRNLQ